LPARSEVVRMATVCSKNNRPNLCPCGSPRSRRPTISNGPSTCRTRRVAISDSYRDAGAELKPSDLKRLVEAGHHDRYLDASDYGGFQESCGCRSTRLSRTNGCRPPSDSAFSTRSSRRDAGGLSPRKCGPHGQRDQQAGRARRRHWSAATTRSFGTPIRFCTSITATFTHSANVAYYTVMLAHALGHTDRDVLRKLGAGALLHDIGKLGNSRVDSVETGRLTPEERKACSRTHPAPEELLSLREQEAARVRQHS